MKNLSIFLLLLTASFSFAQEKVELKKQTVEASCGQCQLGLEGHGCDLAIRYEGKSYFVEGEKSIESFGDAHAKDGFCNAIRTAVVTGTIREGKFYTTDFDLKKVDEKAKK